MTVQRYLVAVALSLTQAIASGAEPAPLTRLTIVDGDAIVIRAASRFPAPVGLPLLAGDIVESTKATHLVRIEFADKAIVDLGPQTRVMLQPPLPAVGSTLRPRVYTLSGWIKLTPPPLGTATALTRSFEVNSTGAVVVHVEPQEASVFAEIGDGVVLPRGPSPAEGDPVTFKAGQFVSAADGAPPRLARQVPPAWAQGVPVSLRDSLPRQLDAFANAKVAVKAARTVVAADVSEWLAAEPALRQLFRSRWASLAREADARETAPRSPRVESAKERSPLVAGPTAQGPVPTAVASPASAVAASSSVPGVAPQNARAEPYEAATFAAADKSVQGGAISVVAYSERPGEAVVAPLTVRNGELQVAGEFVTKGQSDWAGIGVSVNLYSGPTDAKAYSTLRIRLGAAAGVNTLRLRIVGADKAGLKSGCYPIFQQTVTPQVRTYDIPLNRFVPESFCGNAGITATETMSTLVGIEVADTVRPFASRAVSFRVGAVHLVK